MNAIRKPFKVSSRLKDLIGQNLITNNSVAVFELVKNSFDAHATHVHLLFEPGRIVVADNGKGMSREAILEKWLFVAYSAKREGVEDSDYRARLGTRRRTFAGDKGVGRFSCDRLGKQLVLTSRAAGHPVQLVRIDWTKYEVRATREFRQVMVNIEETATLPSSLPRPGGATGTILEVTDLRYEWTRTDLQRLRQGLEKLINPFGNTDANFNIELFAPSEVDADARQKARNAKKQAPDHHNIVNGPIRNSILEAVGQRTTSIRVVANRNAGDIETILTDRGETIYRIREENPYSRLIEPEVNIELYFLNRKAKAVFASRMGLPSIQFGSVFLFRNGFRVFPIGEPDDDFYGLDRRKQQGTRRYLSTRDLIGRVDLSGGNGFEEATSRDQGLIQTPGVAELRELIQERCVRRLERYVVDITWKDPHDQLVDDTSRMQIDANSALITDLVSGLAGIKGVDLLEYNEDLVRIVDEKSDQFESSLMALEVLAEKTGNPGVLRRVKDARSRMAALEEAEAQARQAQQRAEEEVAKAHKAVDTAGERFVQERERNRFLMAASSLDTDTILNLHHQILMYSADVQVGVQRMMRRLRKGSKITKTDWTDFLEGVTLRNRQILTAARFATKSGYRTEAVQREQDLAGYIEDYIEMVAKLWAPRGIRVACKRGETELVRPLRPVDMGIVVDNLVSNAAKANASKIVFAMEQDRSPNSILVVHVADDGHGWKEEMKPIDRVFDKGVTGTNGSGLGLYHVRQIVEGMRGKVRAHCEPYNEDVPGAHVSVSIGK